MLGRLLKASEQHLQAFTTVAVGKSLPEPGSGQGPGNGPDDRPGGMGQGKPGGMGQRGTGQPRADANRDGICDMPGEPVNPGQGATPGGRQGGRRGRNR